MDIEFLLSNKSSPGQKGNPAFPAVALEVEETSQESGELSTN